MPLIQELDYGTPAVSRREHRDPEHRRPGRHRPRRHLHHARRGGGRHQSAQALCHRYAGQPSAPAALCLVEIEGRNGTPASCTTPVAPGMKVHTASERVRRIRRGVMELYISDHPLDCLTCTANGNCELQDAAGEVGLREVRYGYDGANHLDARGRRAPTRISSSTPRSASSAPAACAPARKCRAPSR